MSHLGKGYDINQTFIIEPLSITGGSPTLSACTSLYTNAVVSCSGDTTIFMGTGIISFDGNMYTNDELSASTINASTFYSGGTNLLNIINSGDITGGTFNNSSDTLTLYKPNSQLIITGFTDYYTTGTTLIGSTVYFNRNDQMSAYSFTIDAIDKNVTGMTFNDNQLIITRNDDVKIGSFINTFTGLTINGTLDVSNIHASTISATTYLNLPIDVRVTGGTYNSSTGITTLTNNTGGTFSINGFFTGSTDVFVTGGTFNNATDIITFTNNTGGTFTVTGITDYSITGGTFTTTNKTLRYTKDNNINIDVILPVRLFFNSSATTSSNTLLTIDTASGITDNTNSFIVSYIQAFKDTIDYGFWKRTLAINKVSGITTIIGENSDFDRISSGMTSNSVIYSANSGNILIQISGETAKNYTWTSNWEIIK